MNGEPAQAAAVCYRVTPGGAIETLLVTTSAGRWTAPKGAIDPGVSATEAAAIEALEEAGVRGPVCPRSLGEYRILRNGKPHVVRVFALRVDCVLDQWKEQHERRRLWITLEGACALVHHDDLARAMRTLRRRLLREAQEPSRRSAFARALRRAA